MTLTACVTLRTGRYEAGGLDDRLPETVPSPFRLFCALVSVAGRHGDPSKHVGLRWLEQQAPPDIVVPAEIDRGRTDTFFVTNRVDSKGGSMTHPGRQNGAKHRSWISFRGPGFRFVWHSTPDAAVLESLRELAGGVTYLGRVESTARVEFSTDSAAAPGPDDRLLRQVPLGTAGASVPAPYPGVVDALVDAFERGASAWEVARGFSYAMDEPSAPEVVRGPFDSMLVFSIDGQPVAGSNVLDLTAALRSAVIARVKAINGHDQVPDAVHGHQRDMGHLGYLGLAFADHDRSDGRVLGLAVATPADLGNEVRQVLAQAIADPSAPFTEVSYGRARGGRLSIEFDPFSSRARTLTAAHWQGGRDGRRTWATVTPLMLDRFPARDEPIESAVAACVVRAGYPAPELVEVSQGGFVPGAVRYRRGWSRPFGSRPRRPLWHARLRFAEPVSGPVMIGSLRYLGGGLCVPVQDHRRPERQGQGAAAEVAGVAT